MARASFRTYLLICIGAVAALPVIVFGAWQARRVTARQLVAADREHLLVARALAREIEQTLGASTEIVAAMARQAQTLPKLEPKLLQPLVVAQHAPVQGFLLLGVADSKAVSIAADPIVETSGKSAIGVSYADRDYVQEMTRTRRRAISRPLLSRMTGLPVVAFAEPILGDDGALRGYAYGSYNLNEVRALAERQARLIPQAKVVVLDRAGRVITHPDPAAYRALRDLSAEPLYQGASIGGETIAARDEQGVPMRGASVKIASLGWSVVVARPEAAIHASALQTSRASLGVGAAALLGALAIAFVLSGWLASPITALAQTAARLGEGDFSVAIPRPRRGEAREVATLLGAVGEMAGNLRGLVLAIRQAKERLREAVGALGEVVRDQNEAVERQSSSVVELSERLLRVHQGSASAAARAQTVLAVAEEADRFNVAGQSGVAETLAGLSEIGGQATAMRETIATLLGRTRQIEEVTSTAKDLADQSNLLALNAAIEATRAGDVGKGFTVVAREMRSLADRSVESTGRIKEILAQIDDAIRGAAELSSSGAGKMGHGIEQVRASGERLQEMTLVVAQTSQAAREIASLVQEQDEEISRVAVALERLTEQMGATRQAIERAEHAAAGLDQTSRQIDVVVDRFRI